MAPPRQDIPFMSLGATSAVAANSTAPAGVQLSGDNTATSMTWRQYRAMNNSNMTVFYAYAANATLAQSAAVIPTNAGAGATATFPLAAGQVEIITAPAGQYWSGITAANFAGQGFFITPGIGL
jgi:hypothetical protein